jgi:hypothetical protein
MKYPCDAPLGIKTGLKLSEDERECNLIPGFWI